MGEHKPRRPTSKKKSSCNASSFRSLRESGHIFSENLVKKRTPRASLGSLANPEAKGRRVRRFQSKKLRFGGVEHL